MAALPTAGGRSRRPQILAAPIGRRRWSLVIGHGLRSLLERCFQNTFNGPAAVEIVKRSCKAEFGVGSHQPFGDRLVGVAPLHGLDDRANVAPHAVVIKLEGEIDLLEPPTTESEQIRPVCDQSAWDVTAPGGVITRQKRTLENMLSHVETSVRSAAATLWLRIVATFSAIAGMGTCPVFQTAS